MISGIGSMGAFDPTSMATQIFKTLDTNSDESIDKTELQTLADNGASLDIGQLLTDLDTNGDGKIDKAETESALKKLADEMQSRFARAGMQQMQPPDPAEMFKLADANGDGGIDKTEFADIGPGDTDEATLDEMFSSIDTDGNGSIDETENEAAMSRMGPPPGGMPPPPPQEKTSSDDTVSSLSAVSTADCKNSSILQLLDALKSSNEDDEETDAAAQSIKRIIDELQNGMVYSRQAGLSVSMSSTQSLFSISA